MRLTNIVRHPIFASSVLGDRVASPYLSRQTVLKHLGRTTGTALSFGVVPQPYHSLAGSELPRQTGLCAVMKGIEGSASWGSGTHGQLPLNPVGAIPVIQPRPCCCAPSRSRRSSAELPLQGALLRQKQDFENLDARYPIAQ